MNASTETAATKPSSFECYRQVWRTWSYWPVFRVLVWIMMLQWAMSLAYLYISDTRPWDIVGPRYAPAMLLMIGSSMLQAILTVAVPLMIVGHVKTQMTGWPSALTPRFRRPHLVVAFLISLVVFVVMACAPAALQVVREYGDAGGMFMSDKRLDPQSPFGTPYVSYTEVNGRFDYSVVNPALFSLAEVVFVFAFTGLVASRFSPWSALAFLVIASAFADARLGRGYYRAGTWTVADHDSLVIAWLFLVDIVLLIGLWMRLGRITVERETLPTDERLPWLSKLLAGRESERAGSLVDAGLWRRVRHRRRMGLGHRFIWITAAYLVFLVGIQVWIDPNGVGLAFCAVFAPGVISALAIGLSWPLRFAALGEVEMLRPARRVAFAREMGLAMLLDAVEIYFATLLAALAPLYFWMPSALQLPQFLPALAAAILTQILIFGAIVWCIRLRSWAVSMGLSVLAVLAISVLVTQTMADRQYALPVAGAAIGITLAADAYRRWLRMDML
ncbi:MAG: hypothetical protein ABSH22_16890 [Tepidisphaeraceae bacterium]